MGLLSPDESEWLFRAVEKTRPEGFSEAEWEQVKASHRHAPPGLFDEAEDRAASPQELWRIRLERLKEQGWDE